MYLYINIIRILFSFFLNLPSHTIVIMDFPFFLFFLLKRFQQIFFFSTYMNVLFRVGIFTLNSCSVFNEVFPINSFIYVGMYNIRNIFKKLFFFSFPIAYGKFNLFIHKYIHIHDTIK